MKYCSTRGGGEVKSFEEVLISAYAEDGGMYMPCKLPMISHETLCAWKDHSFQFICAEIMHLFTDIHIDILREMTDGAFKDFNAEGSPTVRRPPLPMKKLDDLILLDASLGPTLAFKDIGQQMLGRLLDHVLQKQQRRANVLIDTSGDTGPAAIAGVRNCSSVDIFCLYPYGRVSAVQELQMITASEENVHVFRTEGNNDDQSSILKEIFSDAEFVQKHGLCSMNSINWFRIAAQSSYYVWAYLQVYNSAFSIGRKVNFIVPSGALGNAAGGLVAKRMGVPIDRIVCATNANDIVHRTISSGDLRMAGNIQTESPAMDIQFAYNIERVLYLVCNENPDIVRPIMTRLDKQFLQVSKKSEKETEVEKEGVRLDPNIVSRLQETFLSCSVSDAQTIATISEIHKRHDVTLCPHSAIGVHAGMYVYPDIAKAAPTICVLTAHPAKFESTIVKATGAPPRFPESVQAMRSLPHRFECLHKPITQLYQSSGKKNVEEKEEKEEKVEIEEGDEAAGSWRAEWVRVIQDQIVQSDAKKST